ncbi:CoB--CoM heterodisulfide reductase iron-sulfur subunit B family protein [bacterium]|nr:CoB--CoM heterodisulfide reductase iron-sulfur subunit B family protein [bacterium]MBU1025010.1 CoB--CoM heterodisulfide reductase iron-sulfur subunit B family protein [bacterium]
MAEMKKIAPFFGCMINAKYPQFESSVRQTMPLLGYELVDLDGFTCCPDPIYFQAADKLSWLSIAARNIALAEEAEIDLVTCCSGCTSSLAEANHTLKRDEKLREKVNERLGKIGKEFKGTVNVRHIATVMRDDVGYEKITETVKIPLDGFKVVFHYGCHLLKPAEIMNVDDPVNPVILENLIKAIGAEPLSHREKINCCGKSCMNEDMPPKMMFDILSSVENEKPDCLCLICPTCFDQYDIGQIKMNRVFDKKFETPVVYYFQLLALAQGINPDLIGLKWHKIKPKAFLEKIAALAG